MHLTYADVPLIEFFYADGVCYISIAPLSHTTEKILTDILDMVKTLTNHVGAE